MIRLGTVGTSGICDSFLEGAALTNKFSLAAIYSRKIETGAIFGRKHQCDKIFTNLKEMAESDLIDAVYIATPNLFHWEQSRLFLQNGKHVICEKPIVTNANEYEELKALADRKGLIYMEAIIPRHIKTYKSVKSALSKIGKIKDADIKYLQRSSRMDAFLRGEHVNIFDMSLHAGALMDLGVYCVYGAVDLLGAPNGITADKILLSNGADGEGSAVFYYDDFKAKLTYSKTRDGYSQSVIKGEKGSLTIDMISQYTGVTLKTGEEETIIAKTLSKAQQMRGEAERFADYILDFKTNKEDYERAGELCLLVHKSMDEIKKSANLSYDIK